VEKRGREAARQRGEACKWADLCERGYKSPSRRENICSHWERRLILSLPAILTEEEKQTFGWEAVLFNRETPAYYGGSSSSIIRSRREEAFTYGVKIPEAAFHAPFPYISPGQKAAAWSALLLYTFEQVTDAWLSLHWRTSAGSRSYVDEEREAYKWQAVREGWSCLQLFRADPLHYIPVIFTVENVREVTSNAMTLLLWDKCISIEKLKLILYYSEA